MSERETLPSGEGRPKKGTVYRSSLVKPPPAVGTARPVPPAAPAPPVVPSPPVSPPPPVGPPPPAQPPVPEPEPPDQKGRSGTHRHPDAGSSKAIIEDLGESGAAAARWTWVTQRRHLPLAVLVFTIGVAPIALLPSESPIYAGIANIAPTIHTYTLALIGALAIAVWRAPADARTALLLWAPLLVWLLVLAPTAWGGSARTWSGVLQLSLGAGAFIVGRLWAARDRRFGVLSWLFAAVAWAQLLAAALAVVGLPLRRIEGAQSLDIKGRATALTAHPGELSKLLFFCAVCVLLLPQRRGAARWLVWSTLGAIFVGVFLSESRTVLVAVVGLVGLSVLLELIGGRWQRRHLVVVGLTALLGTASLPWLIERFSADPAGGDREHLLDVALKTIGAHPVAGVGVNGYVAVVGQTDRLTQTGVPVHSMFLLSVAELGVLGAVALWLPLGLIIVRAVRRLWQTRGADPAARVLVSAVPGICLIGVTGWGLMQGPYLLVLLLVTGYIGARIGTDDDAG
ncbi:O-antigen ligase family protein [Dactylosporangium sp. NPDC051541]|uniref:O-antigen ligase family protein n=1 Tax=Dactylosporangium sp. NPDC051541 TaxID=3363977 RepID=UPI0037AA6A1C